MKIKVAFYKGGEGWQHKIIRWWTKSIYSHAELVMPDNFTWISISPFLEFLHSLIKHSNKSLGETLQVLGDHKKFS